MCVFCAPFASRMQLRGIPVSAPGLARLPRASMGHAVLLTFSTVGSRLPWSYLHTGTLPRLISFVSHSYENCRVCTQNSHFETPNCVPSNVPSTHLGAGVRRFFRSVHSAFSVLSALNPSFPFLQLSTFASPKSFSCNTYEPPRKCCRQKTYAKAKPFRCNPYKKQGEGWVSPLPPEPPLHPLLPAKRQRPFRSNGGSCEKGVPSSGEKIVTGQTLSFPAVAEEEVHSIETSFDGLARWCSPRALQTATPPAPSAEYSSACRLYCQTGDQNECS